MSFTTENNKENVAEDSVQQTSVSYGRRIAEERAERIRYADEYRRRLQAERESVIKKEKAAVAADIEKERAERLAREEAERNAKLEEQRLEAEKRLNAADEKLKEISAGEDVTEQVIEAPTVAETVEETKNEEVALEADALDTADETEIKEELVKEEEPSEKIIAEETALNNEEKEVEKEEETHTMTNSERIVVHIPVKCFGVSGAEVVPAAESLSVEAATFAPAAVDVASVEEAPVAPIAVMPVTVAPAVEKTVAPASTAILPKNSAKAPAEERKPVTISGGYKIIDVTENYRNDVFNSAIISYGKVVTEGGWESEIEDDDDIVVSTVVENAAEEIKLTEEPALIVEEPVLATEVNESDAEEVNPAVAAVAVVDMDNNFTEKDMIVEEPVYEAPAAYYKEPRAAASASGAKAVKQRKVPTVKNYDITEEYPEAYARAEEVAVPVEQEATERRVPLVAPIPFTVKEGEYKAEPTVEKKKSKRKAKNDFIFDPNQENASRDDAELVREENAEYGEHYDMHQIETEHLRYLTETKKLDKQKTKVQNSKKLDAKAVKDATDSADIRKASEKSAALVGVRMDYDARFSSSDLSIELLKFSENDYFIEKENKRRLRLISKIRKSIKKAKKLEKKATKRYYGVLAAESVKPTVLKNQKKQARLNSLLTKLEALLKERESIDERLIHLYRGAETKSGGRVRARAEAKRYKVAKKVHNKYKRLNRSLDKLKAPRNLKIKIRYLLNTKMISKSTLAYSKYMLKKLKPKGEAKRELKRDIQRSKKSLYNIDKNIRRMMKKAYKYDGSHKKEGGIFRWIIALVVLAAILGGCWYFFGDTLMGMLGMA